MPIRKITSLPQGTFIGKVAIENNSPIRQPFFCGAIQIDMEEYARKQREAKELPDLSDFQLENVWEQTNVPGIAEVYLKDHLRQVIRREWKRSLRLNYDEKDVDSEMYRRLAAMTDAERERILRSKLPDLEKEKVERVIEDNYEAIKDDIKKLIEQATRESEPVVFVEETIVEEMGNQTIKNNKMI